MCACEVVAPESIYFELTIGAQRGGEERDRRGEEGGKQRRGEERRERGEGRREEREERGKYDRIEENSGVDSEINSS